MITTTTIPNKLWAKGLLLIFLIGVLFFIENLSIAQSNWSTLAAGGSHFSGDGRFSAQTSVGQMSAIGTFRSNGVMARQGFIQPWILTEYTSDKLSIDLNIYPNPTQGIVTLRFSESVSEGYWLELVDAMGRPIESIGYQQERELSVDLDDLPSGSYLLRVTLDTRTDSFKIIKL